MYPELLSIIQWWIFLNPPIPYLQNGKTSNEKVITARTNGCYDITTVFPCFVCNGYKRTNTCLVKCSSLVVCLVLVFLLLVKYSLHHHHHQSLIPTMPGLATWILFLHSNLSWPWWNIVLLPLKEGPRCVWKSVSTQPTLWTTTNLSKMLNSHEVWSRKLESNLD